jgi:hypothetical protein
VPILGNALQKKRRVLMAKNTYKDTISDRYKTYVRFSNQWHTSCSNPMQLTIVHEGGGTEGGHPKLNEILLTPTFFLPHF